MLPEGCDYDIPRDDDSTIDLDPWKCLIYRAGQFSWALATRVTDRDGNDLILPFVFLFLLLKFGIIPCALLCVSSVGSVHTWKACMQQSNALGSCSGLGSMAGF